MMIFLSNSYAQKGKIFWTLNTTDHIYKNFFYKSKPKYSTLIDINIGFTSQHNYFISISEGELDVDNKTYFAISPQSPIAKLLLGKTEDDTIRFRSSTFAIVKVM